MPFEASRSNLGKGDWGKLNFHFHFFGGDFIGEWYLMLWRRWHRKTHTKQKDNLLLLLRLITKLLIK